LCYINKKQEKICFFPRFLRGITTKDKKYKKSSFKENKKEKGSGLEKVEF